MEILGSNPKPSLDRRTPRLSVIVPVRDGADFLAESLPALRASDLLPELWELLVVDDASTDRSAEVAGRYADAVVRLAHPKARLRRGTGGPGGFAATSSFSSTPTSASTRTRWAVSASCSCASRTLRLPSVRTTPRSVRPAWCRSTDLFGRGVTWMCLHLEQRHGGRPGTLNLRPVEKLYTLLTGLAAASIGIAAARREPAWPLASAAGLLVVLVGNVPLIRWFGRERGLWFALGVVPLRLLYYGLNAIAAPIGWLQHMLATRKRRRPNP